MPILLPIAVLLCAVPIIGLLILTRDLFPDDTFAALKVRETVANSAPSARGGRQHPYEHAWYTKWLTTNKSYDGQCSQVQLERAYVTSRRGSAAFALTISADNILKSRDESI